MSKQVYIDENGNEIQVSGTVNTADMMPMSGNDSTKVSEAIGDLSDLTTTDKSSLVRAINEIASYTRVYGNTASGAIATFDTSLALPLQDCTIDINAVQEGSGTPSPDNVRPITGFSSANVTRCGVNLWDEEWKNGYYNPVKGNYVADEHYICSKNLIKVSPSTQYYIHSDNNILLEVLEYRKNGTFIGVLSKHIANQIITTSNDCAYIHIGTHDSDSITTYTSGISINYPSSETDYHAYNGTTVTISLGQTVYGGSLDVTTGLLTVTWAYIDTWANVNFTFNGSTATYTEVRCALSNAKAYGTSNMKSNKLETGPADLYKINGRANTEYIHFDVPLCANAVEAKQWIIDNGIAVIYELATPVTYQLTPTEIKTILGVNNIWADTNGDTNVVYACSLKDYIDRQ